MTIHSPCLSEPIPGYTVLERLGAGGYGEVWKAVAPGGIEKAIKFIYGYHDEERAARELKALQRVKEVRHPFLLSLDRIEVIDGRLVIVTEIADRSLKDRYQQCRESGARGIDRAELLDHLRDAADALDYMSQHCSLQHLDVKPENLLIVGGRIKVADFGLVRNVREATVSLMGGLTPVYAPPEVFEGRPGLRSDQYSLAIVYVEMLTGAPPFHGATAAQLMAQHLHDPPDLSTLPGPDRAMILRALAKDPKDRFDSCREMIESLRQAPVSAQTPLEAPPPAPAASCPVSAKGIRHHDDFAADGDDSTGNTLVVQVAPLGQPAPSRTSTVDIDPLAADTIGEVVDLPPLDIDLERFALAPTLFVGVGGTAQRVLRRLKQKLFDRLGRWDRSTPVAMLAIDSDMKELLAATSGESRTALEALETIAAPLRRTQDYRSDSPQLLSWISRRWLYNIPRSLTPEGRRPLGRLALIDHLAEIRAQVRSVLERITAEEVIAASPVVGGTSFRSLPPRVYLIASISGGTGGGMSLDLAFALQAVLAELGWQSPQLHGILLHSTGRSLDEHDLAVANACAFLTELKHYSPPIAGFSGVPECDLPRQGGVHGPFSDSYLVHLGDSLSESQWDSATESVAEYLALDSLTPAGTYFDACRRTDNDAREAAQAAHRLRTFGISRVGSPQVGLPDLFVHDVCRQVAQLWRGPIGDPANTVDTDFSPDVHGRAETLAQSAAVQLGLNDTSLMALATERLLESTGLTAEKTDAQWRETVRNRPSVLSDGALWTSIAGWLQHRLAVDPAQASDGPPALGPLLAQALEPLEQAGLALGNAIRQWLVEQVDDPTARIASACRSAEWFAGTLHRQDELLQQRHAQLSQRLAGWHAQRIAPTAPRGAAKPAGRTARSDEPVAKATAVRTYFELAWEIVQVRAAMILLRRAAGNVASAVDELRSLRRDLNQFASQCGAWHPPAGDTQTTWPQASAPLLRDWMTARVREQIPAIVRRLDEQLTRDIQQQYGGLLKLFRGGSDALSRLPAELRERARRAIVESLVSVDVAQWLAELGPARDHVLDEWIRDATPALIDDGSGGARRLVVMGARQDPEDPIPGWLAAARGETCRSLPDTLGDVVFCYEVERLSYAHAAARITSKRNRFGTLASRLHTRVDVAFAPIEPLVG